MSYALRNTLILVILLMLVLSFILYYNLTYSKQLRELNTFFQEKSTTLLNLITANPDYKDIDIVTAEYEAMKRQQRETGKIIPKSNTPADTYSYLLSICERYSRDVKFNFELIAANSVLENYPNIYYNIYSVEGVAPVNSIYTFLLNVEKQVMFYTIENLHLTEENESKIVDGDKTTNISKVSFKLTLNAYYDTAGEDENLPPTRDLRYPRLAYNPFYSRIHEPNYKSEEEKFINIDSCTLIGLTPEKVFLRDSEENVLVVSIGDKVAYGKLDRIEWENQAAVFKINDTGIYKEKILLLHKE